ncbi:MAG: hypothetical protein KC912_26775, partial [Proteobacteria bacterium]|nr:hypothetical protein [Pseudomonadota bacterium]
FRSMPPATPHFVPQPDGMLQADAWKSGWDASDHDQDGFPGIAVKVSATLCGGTMHFASAAETVARAKPHNEGIIGRANIRVAQEVHKVQGACLSLVTKDMTQDLRGVFGYFPVSADTTCDTVSEASWPDPTAFDLEAFEAPPLPEAPAEP